MNLIPTQRAPLTLSALMIGLALLLPACGGGGGSDTSAIEQAPAAAPILQPQNAQTAQTAQTAEASSGTASTAHHFGHRPHFAWVLHQFPHVAELLEHPVQFIDRASRPGRNARAPLGIQNFRAFPFLRCHG